MLSDGEQWTRDELDRLRAARWRPSQLASFLGAAQDRANDTRRARAGLGRQERTWMLAGAGAWLTAGRLQPDGPWRPAGLGWWAGCALMVDWHLGMLETLNGEPVDLGAADALTLLRAWLVPAVAQAADPALVALGALSDLADGHVARATRCTRFGRDLEGLVDACFFIAGMRGAVASGGLSPLPARLERVRLLTGAVVATGTYFVTARAPDPRMRAGGRYAAPVRVGALLAAGGGRRQLADRLLCCGTALAVVGPLLATRSVRERTR